MKKADLIVIAVVLAVAGILVFVLYGMNDNNGSFVQVEIDGKIVDTFPINEDITKEYVTDKGRNTLVIENASVLMTEADCPDGICKRHSAISRSGESIICLPHKLIITVTDTAENEAEIDAVA